MVIKERWSSINQKAWLSRLTWTGRVTCCWDPLLFVGTELTIREFKQSKGRREGVGVINQDGFSFWAWMLTLSYCTCTGTGSARHYFIFVIHRLLNWASHLPKRKHTHIYITPNTHTGVHPYVRMHTLPHPDVHTDMYTHIFRCAHTQTYTYRHRLAFTHIYARGHTCIHNADTRRHAHTCWHVSITHGAHTQTRTHIASLLISQTMAPERLSSLSWIDQTPSNSGIMVTPGALTIQCNCCHFGSTWYIPGLLPGVWHSTYQPLCLFSLLSPFFLSFSTFSCLSFYFFLSYEQYVATFSL